MYCPICGAQSTHGLNYCKRCGTNINSPAPASENERRWTVPPFAFLFAAIVCIAGFIALFSTIVALAEHGIDPKVLVAITAFGGGTVVAVVGMFAWLLLRLAGVPMPTRQDRVTAVEMPQIAAPPLSAPSVTEHTTRNFDPVRARERETDR